MNLFLVLGLLSGFVSSATILSATDARSDPSTPSTADASVDVSAESPFDINDILGKISAGIGEALASSEKLGKRDPFSEFIEKDFNDIFSVPSNDPALNKLKEILISDKNGLKNLLESDELKKIFSDESVKKMITGNGNDLDDSTHKQIDQLMSKMFKMPTEEIALKRKKIFSEFKSSFDANSFFDAFDMKDL